MTCSTPRISNRTAAVGGAMGRKGFSEAGTAAARPPNRTAAVNHLAIMIRSPLLRPRGARFDPAALASADAREVPLRRRRLQKKRGKNAGRERQGGGKGRGSAGALPSRAGLQG